jgi:CRISPR-associated exonuclease Cas4
MTEAVARPDRLSVPLAALEHHGYCPRQAALIHVDAYFDTNADTVRGDLAHAAVDHAGPNQDRHGHRIWHSLPVWSEGFGLHGVCDVVEFVDGRPRPVEHKSGAFRPGGPAELQVAGQALCLREMFDAPVPVGVLFAGRGRRRHEIVVDGALVARVVRAADAIRDTIVSGLIPPPVRDQRCVRCSLRPGCEPGMPTANRQHLFLARAPDLTGEM